MSNTPNTDDLSYLGGADSGELNAASPTVSESVAQPLEKPRALMVRLPAALHSELQALAIETGLSMNEFVVYATEDLVTLARSGLDDEWIAKVARRRADRKRQK